MDLEGRSLRDMTVELEYSKVLSGFAKLDSISPSKHPDIFDQACQYLDDISSSRIGPLEVPSDMLRGGKVPRSINRLWMSFSGDCTRTFVWRPTRTFHFDVKVSIVVRVRVCNYTRG
jgi:hypothetical protein